MIVSCGGQEKKPDASENVEKESKKKSDKVAYIGLTSNDAMKFNKKEIKVKAGQKVKLTLRHIGSLNKMLMGHNVVILKKGVDPVKFAALAAAERENDYIPKDSQDILVYTKLIGGGETTSIEFTAPEAGTYEFLCSFPGHIAMMRGKFIVE